MKLLPLITLIVAALLGGGCAGPPKESRRPPPTGPALWMDRAPANPPPAVPLDLNVARPPLSLTLDTAIFFNGPGSWMKSACWEEYIVTLRNDGMVPVQIDLVTLHDETGAGAIPGTHPWELQRESTKRIRKLQREAWRKNTSSQEKVALVPVAIGALWATPYLMAVVLPVAIAVGPHNSAMARELKLEFDRRRLALPATLAPGAAVHGSLFFPFGRKSVQIRLAFRAAGAPDELVLDLPATLALPPQSGDRPTTSPITPP